MEEMIKKVVFKKPKASPSVITMRVAKNILMEKVLVSLRGLYLDDRDLVTLLGEFIVVANPNIQKVIQKVKRKVCP